MNQPLSFPAKILLVEDDALTRESLKYLLASAGYQVSEASDGQEGVEIFAQQPDAIDLVLSDLMMPCLDGLEMLQVLKRLRPQVKLILITGAPDNAQAWHDQGIHDWLAKPFEVKQLLSKVEAALAA